MARIFVRGHYLFPEANSFPRTKIQLMCLLSYKHFSQHAGFENWKDHFDIPLCNRGIFSHIMRLEQSRASEYI